jgi:hypothetical protein
VRARSRALRVLAVRWKSDTIENFAAQRRQANAKRGAEDGTRPSRCYRMTLWRINAGGAPVVMRVYD